MTSSWYSTSCVIGILRCARGRAAGSARRQAGSVVPGSGARWRIYADRSPDGSAYASRESASIILKCREDATRLAVVPALGPGVLPDGPEGEKLRALSHPYLLSPRWRKFPGDRQTSPLVAVDSIAKERV
jgi:hypothetical protein